MFAAARMYCFNCHKLPTCLVCRLVSGRPAGAEVTFRYKGRSAASSRGTAGQVADTSSTLADGTFSSSMLYDDVAYSVSVSKPGYAFQEQSADPLVFSSRKLSQVGRGGGARQTKGTQGGRAEWRRGVGVLVFLFDASCRWHDLTCMWDDDLC
jgi:hypothetical protein